MASPQPAQTSGTAWCKGLRPARGMTLCSVNQAASSRNWYWDSGGDGPEKTLAKAARGGDINVRVTWAGGWRRGRRTQTLARRGEDRDRARGPDAEGLWSQTCLGSE